jgi:hypothetical protein
MGGPLKRDRVWFYASARKYESSSYWAGNYYNMSPNPLFYEADLSRPAYDRNLNQETSLHHVAGDAEAEGHRLGALRWNCYCNPVSGGGISPEAAREQLVRSPGVGPGVVDLPGDEPAVVPGRRRDARRHPPPQAGR